MRKFSRSRWLSMGVIIYMIVNSVESLADNKRVCYYFEGGKYYAR